MPSYPEAVVLETVAAPSCYFSTLANVTELVINLCDGGTKFLHGSRHLEASFLPIQWAAPEEGRAAAQE
jgi:hypothetical protein